MNKTNGIENITARIISDAQAQADALVKSAEDAAAVTARDYQMKAADISDRIIKAAEHDAANITARAESSAAMERRNLMLSAKSAAIDAAFEAAHEAMKGLKRGEYLAYQKRVLTAAVRQLLAEEREAVSLYGDTERRSTEFALVLDGAEYENIGNDLLSAAEKLLTPEGCTAELVRASVELGGGFILRRGEVDVNCTLNASMTALRDSLEGKVAELLF